MNWFIPALAKRRVGSLGTREELRTTRWPRCSKYLRKALRISSAVLSALPGPSGSVTRSLPRAPRPAPAAPCPRLRRSTSARAPRPLATSTARSRAAAGRPRGGGAASGSTRACGASSGVQAVEGACSTSRSAPRGPPRRGRSHPALASPCRTRARPAPVADPAPGEPRRSRASSRYPARPRIAASTSRRRVPRLRSVRRNSSRRGPGERGARERPAVRRGAAPSARGHAGPTAPGRRTASSAPSPPRPCPRWSGRPRS